MLAATMPPPQMMTSCSTSDVARAAIAAARHVVRGRTWRSARMLLSFGALARATRMAVRTGAWADERVWGLDDGAMRWVPN
jgi:hypothetical protein